jgi:hypothetical protein
MVFTLPREPRPHHAQPEPDRKTKRSLLLSHYARRGGKLQGEGKNQFTTETRRTRRKKDLLTTKTQRAKRKTEPIHHGDTEDTEEERPIHHKDTKGKKED